LGDAGDAPNVGTLYSYLLFLSFQDELLHETIAHLSWEFIKSNERDPVQIDFAPAAKIWRNSQPLDHSMLTAISP
jgi:hypothetical protein